MSEARVWAPPFAYGPWQTLWTRFGVVGPDSDKNRTTLSIGYQSVSQAPSRSRLMTGKGAIAAKGRVHIAWSC